MEGYELQFGPEDVARKMRQVHDSLENGLSYLAATVSHSINSPLMGVIGPTSAFLDEGCDDFIQDQTKRAQIAEICDSVNQLTESYRGLMSASQQQHFPAEQISELSERFCETLDAMLERLSACAYVEYDSYFTESQRERMSRMFTYAEIAVYNANANFAAELQRDGYYLNKDLSHVCAELVPAFAQEGIFIEESLLDTIAVSQDYVANAVLPLVLNAREHAFNPENDVYERMTEPGFSKKIKIRGGAEESEDYHSPVESGDYTVRVEDNGFGMRPGVLDTLFEKGSTTKQDDRTQHGIGLWAVKHFVESNGGTIGVETELGKGTAFTFTIPYSHKDSFVCIQGTVHE